ncbi:oligosaccharide flippase family protein [Chromohalobacter sp. 11-W]|uniref:oligosaccharide flippase family protein n=1 Tax=Chromohalobacter sp. 11-W TaxID=2994061 RepID=UPI002469AE6E|nr:oligosaccharide flippase family protein [Chromohalobacter sp. 11-W]
MGVGAMKLLSVPLTFLASILLARGLGPEGFGQYAFVIALITTLSIPLAPAMMQLTTRETAALHQSGQEDLIRALLRWANRHVLIGSVLAIMVVGSVAVWMADWRADDRWTMLLAGLTALPLLGFNAVRSGILAGLRRVVQGQFAELFVRPLTLLLVAASLLLAGALNPLTALLAFLAGVTLAFVVGSVLLRRTFAESEEVTLPDGPVKNRQWLRAWVPFTLLVMASTLNAQVGILLLGWMSTDEQVAAMQVAERGGMLVVLSLTVVNLVIGPHITRIHRSGDRARLQAISRHSARMALVVALPIALPLIFFGKSILNVIFGAEYAEIATWPLVILAISQLVNVVFGSVGRLLVMSGYEAHSLLGQLVALLVVVVCSFFLIPAYGATGASVAIGFGILIWNVVLSFKVYYVLGIRPGVV